MLPGTWNHYLKPDEMLSRGVSAGRHCLKQILFRLDPGGLCNARFGWIGRGGGGKTEERGDS